MDVAQLKVAALSDYESPVHAQGIDCGALIFTE